MGFFSWKTSDTKKSIRNIHTNKCRPVFLLQPNGEAPIEEPGYQGYGEFGGKDAYVWLAERNLPPQALDKLDLEGKRSAGVALAHGNLIRIGTTGQLVAVFHNHAFLKDCGIDVLEFGGSWNDEIPGVGKSANTLLDERLAARVAIRELVPIRYPLKFSFKPSAIYGDLPEAETCPDQGFF